MTNPEQIVEQYRQQMLRMAEILEAAICREKRLLIEIEAMRTKMDYLSERIAKIMIAHN